MYKSVYRNNTSPIVGITDLSVGYGSPQITALLQSLRARYGTRAVLLENDQSERPPAHDLYPDLEIERIPAPFHPYSGEGRIWFVKEVTARLKVLRPKMLVLFASHTLPVLMRLRKIPDFVVYYALEAGENPAVQSLVHDEIDLLLFPEENRAACELGRTPYRNTPVAVVYNAINKLPATTPVPTAEKTASVFYGGTIERGKTFAEYFVDPRLGGHVIDLYGLVEGPDKEATRTALTSNANRVRYHGYVHREALTQLRRHHAYSLVMWAPDSEAHLYACPNKLFEAIADGVPPISAPHPQCKMLIERYRCGIVMNDWSFSSFRNAIDEAMSLFGTPAYEEMVANCARAVQSELNWDAQFDKVSRWLPEDIAYA